MVDVKNLVVAVNPIVPLSENLRAWSVCTNEVRPTDLLIIVTILRAPSGILDKKGPVKIFGIWVTSCQELASVDWCCRQIGVCSESVDD